MRRGANILTSLNEILLSLDRSTRTDLQLKRRMDSAAAPTADNKTDLSKLN